MKITVQQALALATFLQNIHADAYDTVIIEPAERSELWSVSQIDAQVEVRRDGRTIAQVFITTTGQVVPF